MTRRYEIIGDWICEKDDSGACTCGAGGLGFGHEPHCGWEPVATIAGSIRAAERPRGDVTERQISAADGAVDWTEMHERYGPASTWSPLLRRHLAVTMLRAAGLVATPAQQDDATAALRELVRLKDGPRDDSYRAAKDAAWKRARRVLRGGASDE